MFVCVHVFIDSEIQINGFSYTSPSLLPAMACLGLLSCAFVMTEISMMLMILVLYGNARAPETDGTCLHASLRVTF